MRYFSHATGGHSAAFDRQGRDPRGRGIEEVPAEIVDEVRRRFGALAALCEWSVVVHEDGGEVATPAFSDLAPVERALAAA